MAGSLTARETDHQGGPHTQDQVPWRGWGQESVCLKEALTPPSLIQQSLLVQLNHLATEKINLKFIDTTSKFGHGRYQWRKRRSSWCILV
eukprot:XP_014049261.1 PREDICTED: 60S ribosomal protein L3-like [Salmo salar]